MIYTGNAIYKLLKRQKGYHADPFDDRHSKGDDYPPWQGTVAGIDISLTETPAFSTLLDRIHDIYIATIKERKKQKYRRPRFI
ncbi:MAG: hypothetical protein ABIJ21_07410 [Nanoarchaeota archaeon]